VIAAILASIIVEADRAARRGFRGDDACQAEDGSEQGQGDD
jgi:hypothetical protein